MREGLRSRAKILGQDLVQTGAALVVALAIAFVVIALTSKAPLDAIEQLLGAPIQRQRTVGLWLDDAAKLTVAGLAFSLVFQARQFSIGLQGQVYMGGLAASVVAESTLGAGLAAIPCSLLAGMAAGAAYGFIPGWAKARLGANEIVSSLMLNYIAVKFVGYLIRVVFAPVGVGVLMSDPFPAASIFPALVAHTRIDLGLVLAIVALVVVWFALYRTGWGLRLRLVGHNATFSAYAGIDAGLVTVSAMTASGALGGLLGVMFVEGQAFGKLAIDFDGGLAFEGILVATVARSRPLAVPIVALLYSYLREGANLMGIRTDVPVEIIAVVQAFVILLAASSFEPRRRKLRPRTLAITEPDVAAPIEELRGG